MKALDLFCGLGGWSDGLAAEGFTVEGIELDSDIAAQYKHPVYVADITKIDPEAWTGYDLIVGSPPCRDYSQFARTFGHTWKIPPDPLNNPWSLPCVYAMLNFVKVAKPTYWLMENVVGLTKIIDLKPRSISYIGRSRHGLMRAFWGNYPAFLVPMDATKKRMDNRQHGVKKDIDFSRSNAERAKIPMGVATALGRTIKNALEGLSELSINSKSLRMNE